VVGGSANFKKVVNESTGLTHQSGTYNCYGWSGDTLPSSVCSVDNLATAHNAVGTQDGKPMEALLCRYEDVDGYRRARAEYFAANPDKPDFDFIDVSKMPISNCSIVTSC
jgi:hypothetical protein